MRISFLHDGIKLSLLSGGLYLLLQILKNVIIKK